MRGLGPWNRLWLYSVPRGQGRLLGTYEGPTQNRSFRGNSTRHTQPALLGDRVPPLSPPRKNNRTCTRDSGRRRKRLPSSEAEYPSF